MLFSNIWRTRVCKVAQRNQWYYTVHTVLIVIGMNGAALPVLRQVQNPMEFACRSPKTVLTCALQFVSHFVCAD